jgi:hypothetical protein
MRLSLLNSQNQTAPPSTAPNCVDNFVNILMDGCDGNDPINNPHNYKFGGNLTTPDGWLYEMEPLHNQTDEDSCDVTYKVLFDSFEIWGMNFPDAKLGLDGAGLLTQLKGCGDVTGWSFTLTPDDVKYQWYAKGNLPIGTKACVGRAIQSAGGSSAGGCTGAG